MVTAAARTGPAPHGATDAPPLRFNDVIGELHRIADIAARVDEAGGSEIVAACRRAESLLSRLRNQFLRDLLSADRLGEVVAA